MKNKVEYAGFWIRVGATVIDVIILLIVTGIPLTIIYGSDYWTSEEDFHGAWDAFISYIFPVVATIWLWLKFFGTPGKILLKLKIVDANSFGKISIGQAIGRYLGYIVSAIPLLLGYFWVGFNPKKQSWHDMMAKTVVIRGEIPEINDA